MTDGIECYLRINPNAFVNTIDNLMENEYGRRILKISDRTARTRKGQCYGYRAFGQAMEVQKRDTSRDKLIHIPGEPKVLLQPIQRYYPECLGFKF